MDRETLNALTIQRAYVKHWLEDLRCNLKPEKSSLESALGKLNAAIENSRENTDAR